MPLKDQHSPLRGAAQKAARHALPVFFMAPPSPSEFKQKANYKLLDSEAETISVDVPFDKPSPPRALPIPFHRHIRLTAVGAFS